MLHAHLLGTAAFKVGGTLYKSDLGHPGRLLASYLFQFSGHVHRRERVAHLFWPELVEERARSALNTALWRIRNMLDRTALNGGRILVKVGHNIVLEPCPLLHVDTHELQRAATCTEALAHGNVLGSDDERRMTSALTHYAGPFLDGDDEDWVLQEREHLQSLFICGNLRLMRVAARQRRYDRAIVCIRRVLAIDPWREAAQRDLLFLLALSGQSVEAIQAYERFRKLLRKELDIEPMPETKRLDEEIRSGAIFHRAEDYIRTHFERRERTHPDRGATADSSMFV